MVSTKILATINPELTVTMLNNQTIKDSYNIIFEYLDNIIFI